MAPPSSASPTALLWAHKLQIEHGHLLQRVQDLEAKSTSQDSRISKAETLAQKSTSSTEVADLAKKVKVLDDASVVDRLNDMEKTVDQKLEHVNTDARTMKYQITTLRDEQTRAEEAREVDAGLHSELLGKISEVERGLKSYGRSLESMGRRLDDAKVQLIRTHLTRLAEQVKDQGEEMRFVARSIAALEKSNVELRKAVERNELKAGSGKKGGQLVAAAEVELGQPVKKKVKSHKRNGGGADRDIIAAGMSESPGSRRRRSIEDGRTKGVSETSGGNVVRGGDFDASKAVDKTATFAKTDQARAMPKPASVSKKRPGWDWEVVPDIRPQPSAEKRKPGRPRKAHVPTPVWDIHTVHTQGRSTRHKDYSSKNNDTTTRKRDAKQAFPSPRENDSVTKAELVNDLMAEDDDDQSTIILDSQGPKVGAETSRANNADAEPDSSPAPPRRPIVQDEDLDMS